MSFQSGHFRFFMLNARKCYFLSIQSIALNNGFNTEIEMAIYLAYIIWNLLRTFFMFSRT